MSKWCDTNWGSHSCFKKPGHRFGHRCDCCPWPLIVHILIHEFCGVGCVGQWPYYGKGHVTQFYGKDV